MILLAGGVAKNYQPPISVILEAVSGHLIAFEDLSVTLDSQNAKKPSGVIAFSQSEEPWTQFEAYISKATETPHIMAFYLPAKLGLAHYLAAGLNPDEAAFAWITTTKSLLEFARKHRKSVFLVNAHTVIQFPEEFIETCVNKYRFNGAEKVESIPKVTGSNDLHGILANQIINQNQDVLKLQQELDARSEPISPYIIPDVFDLKSVFESLNASSEDNKKMKAQLQQLQSKGIQASEELKALKEKYGDLSEENQNWELHNNLLLEQLEVIQGELTEGRKNWELQAKGIEASEELKALKEKYDDLSEENQNWEIHNNLLLEQLEVIQGELIESRKNPDGKLLQSENESLKESLATLRKTHRSALAKTKKITDENSQITSEAKRSAVKDALMSEQMASIQSEAEETYFTYLQVSAELEQVKKVAKWREGKTQRTVSELENDLARTHKRIDNLQQSFSWKLTRPVRILSRVIGLANKRASKNDIDKVYASGFFDRDWYLKTYPDIANISMRPIEHFVRYGAFEGRSPGPGFNTRKYTRENPDVLIDGVNPLLHHLESQNSN